MKYIYNKRTCKLHIENYCKNAKASSCDKNYDFYESEEAAEKANGCAIIMCKICQRKRDSILRQK